MKAIRAEPQSIDRIFGSHEFIIPDFQRPYSWEVEQCEQLWDDISSFIDGQIDNDNKEKYFLGSIVVYPNDKNEHTWEIVDGQQRLTTLLILTRLLFAKASTHTVLQKLFYKTDPKTGDVVNEPRLESKVLAGEGRDDYNDFRKVMELKIDESKKGNKNPYDLNTKRLRYLLHPWWEAMDVSKRERAIDIFQKNIVLLPIVCDSMDDALTLFQVINDRGMKLNDADIFKASIYQMIHENNRQSFVKRWNGMKKHVELFRIHMHVLRAKSGDTTKEIGLRRYMQDHFKELPEKGEHEANSIMQSLEHYCSVRQHGALPSSVHEHWKEKIYWEILRRYPNIYWWYPLHVFLNKYGKESGGFFLDEKHYGNYVELMENTVRYFYIKGVVYNTVNRVKDTTFKVCDAIEKEENYADQYRENLVQDQDLENFNRELQGTISERYQRGLVLLSASLNSEQNMERLVRVAKGCHIEHILPKEWNHYDGWNQEIYGENIEKLGNKVPLEWRLNIKASNEFFARKQKYYKDSQIQDAIELSQKRPAQWYPEDVQKRQEIMLDRLNRFFSAIA